MFKDVKDMQISGGCYGDGTMLEGILSQRMNIVYGRNGSGKSSLAKAISDYANGVEDSRFSMSFSPELDDEAKDHMCVYSEDFVLDNVRLQKEGLEQIVMIGEQVDLSHREDILKAEKGKVGKSLDEARTKLAEYQEQKGSVEKSLINAIKDGYANREREFRGLTNRPKVNQDTISAIYQKRTEGSARSIAVLTNEIAEDTQRLLGAIDAQRVVWSAPDFNMPYMLQVCSSLLEKKVQQVELDERDRHLMAILTSPSLSHYVDDAKHDLIDAKATTCPLCQQPLTPLLLQDLEAQIRRVLNKEVEEYKSELADATDAVVDLDCRAPSFPVDVYDADIRSFDDAVAKINRALEEVRHRLQTKANNLFNSEEALDQNALRQLYVALEYSCVRLENDVRAFNRSIDDKKSLENDLKTKNQILAYWENRPLFDMYYAAIGNIDQTQLSIVEHEGRLKQIKDQLKDLESQRSQTKIAIDFINRCISSIFFDKDRLVLEQAQGKFVLRSRGMPVAPDSVSTGERNIIGLAYFFATLFKNTSEQNRFRRPYLVVIDDPVTSFDQDNRLGVMTFLKEQLTDLLVKSDDSKVLVMSHDQRTIDLLVGINGSAENYIKHKSGQTGHDDYYVYELHRRARRKVSQKTKSEYSQMLNLLYSFAQDDDPERIEYVGIGNTIRRVLETFSLMTFNTADYVRVVDSRNLWLRTPLDCDRERVKNVYRRMLTRIVLNPESHSATLIDQDSYESTFTRESLQKLAQCALTFIMCVNEQHLWTSLGRGWKDNVTGWFIQQVCN